MYLKTVTGIIIRDVPIVKFWFDTDIFTIIIWQMAHIDFLFVLFLLLSIPSYVVGKPRNLNLKNWKKSSSPTLHYHWEQIQNLNNTTQLQYTNSIVHCLCCPSEL